LVSRPTARVLTVLELLQAHGRMTGAELARRLEVDIRTVRNYGQTLIDLGIPVEAEPGHYGAYRLRAGYKLPPLIFTEDEALALTLSLLVARESGLAASTPAFEGVLAKVERVLAVSRRARIQAVEQTVIFESAAAPTAPKGLAVMVLSSAIQSGR
jgi:predicted DNA-binding transcriptional regulator YafY